MRARWLLVPLLSVLGAGVALAAECPALLQGELPKLAAAVAALPRLTLRGLMAIPEPAPDFETARGVFTQVRALFDALNAQGLGLDTLSMGMSDDLEAAVAAGSTLVRVGRGVFGARSYAP